MNTQKKTRNDVDTFVTSGPLRVEAHHNGYYVLGEGKMFQVRDRDEGLKLIEVSKMLTQYAPNRK